jgi:hypothetical protein
MYLIATHYWEQNMMSESTHDLAVQDMLKRVFQIAQIAVNSDVDLVESFVDASTNDKNQPQKHTDAIPG